MSGTVMVNWLSILVTVGMGVLFLRSKRYSHLRWIPVYAFGSAGVSILLALFLSQDWYAYLASVVLQSILYFLAYNDVHKDVFGSSHRLLVPGLIAVLAVPFLPILFLFKLILPFLIVNGLILSVMTRAFAARNSILILMAGMSSWSFAFNALKLVIGGDQALALFGAYDFMIGRLFVLGMIFVVSWRPVTVWLYQQLSPIVSRIAPQLVVAPVQHATQPLYPIPGGDVVPFPFTGMRPGSESGKALIDEMKGDMDRLEPILKTAAQMVTISRKPFLNQEELALYLDVDPATAEQFVHSHQISRIYLIEGSDYWVVRRLDVDFLVEEMPR